MSRYTISIRCKSNQARRDTTGVVGYDRMLRTYFAQGFEDHDSEQHEFWIGCFLAERRAARAATVGAVIPDECSRPWRPWPISPFRHR